MEKETLKLILWITDQQKKLKSKTKKSVKLTPKLPSSGLFFGKFHSKHIKDHLLLFFYLLLFADFGTPNVAPGADHPFAPL